MISTTAARDGLTYSIATDVKWEPRGDYFVLGGGNRSGLRVVTSPVIDLLERTREGGLQRTQLRGLVGSEGRDVNAALSALEATFDELVESAILVARDEAKPDLSDRSNSERFSHLFFELTSRCNLRCKHCYMEGGLAKPVELRLQHFMNLVEDFAALGGQYLTLSGGEPLLFAGWPVVAEYGAGLGLQLSLMTNGTYLDKRALSIIQRLGIAVGLGFDGFTAESHDANRGRGSFTQATAALRLLVGQGYAKNTSICFSPMRHSVYDLPALIDMMLRSGLPRLYVSLLEDRGRASYFRDRISLTADQRRWLLQYLYDESARTMGALQIEVTHHVSIFTRLLYDIDHEREESRNLTVRVTSDGEVYLSAYMGAPEHCVGNASEHSLRDMLESDRATEILAACERRPDRIAKCRSCVYRKTCGGGSAALAYSKFGTFDEPDEYCDARIDLFDTIVARQASQLDAAETFDEEVAR
jgi:radical SAM protein with 4Fe4S-binding SPASM domain